MIRDWLLYRIYQYHGASIASNIALAFAIGLCLLIVVDLFVFVALRKLSGWKKRVFRLIAALLPLGLVILFLQFLPYTDNRVHKKNLDLVAVLDTDHEVESDFAYPIYSIRKGPYLLGFEDASKIDIDFLYAEENAWIRQQELELDQYTYFVVLGREVDSVSYNVWQSERVFYHWPWDGIVYYGCLCPERAYENKLQNRIYLYRTERIAYAP